MVPTEAHNTLKRFLSDEFRFRKTFDVYAFLVPFASANSNSNSWSSEDGQLFLKTIANGNGILRINDIILWPSVQFDAGSDPAALSFQKGYFPVLRFLASDFVVKSTLSHLVNALYLRVLENFEHFGGHLEASIDNMIKARTFKDPKSGQGGKDLSGGEIFSSLCVVFFECLSRFKNASAMYPRLPDIVRKLESWTSEWSDGISKSPAVFEDPLSSNQEAQLILVPHLQSKVQRIIAIVNREQEKHTRIMGQRTGSRHAGSTNEGLLSALQTLYDGPGILRKEGPRHDNDFDDINEIRVAPTHHELTCRITPYLPANLYGAPHHLPEESMEKLQDIQYRLLREELTAPLRKSIQCVVNDLQSKRKTQLSNILQQQGGKYKGFAEDGQDGVMFNVYTNVDFMDLVPDQRRGLSAKLRFDAPPGKARTPRPGARVQFWEGLSGKRLIQGGLIGLVWREHDEINIHLGIVASSTKEISDFVKTSQYRVEARIVFFDASLELRILNCLRHGSSTSRGDRILVESPVMFEAIRPFLESLKVEPESIPFKEYLVHHPSLFFETRQVSPPQYARMPGFHYQLAPLFPSDSGITDLKLSVSDPQSVENARLAMAKSRLDPSQATAVIDSLTREIALIQGPPGTGKSFVGVELLRVLIHSAKPILMIAFTNHALDHLLNGVLDSDITRKIVRLGSRSADERISQFSIEALETVAGRNSSPLAPLNQTNYHRLKDVEREIQTLIQHISRNTVTSQDVMDFLETQYPEHYQCIMVPPDWAKALHEQYLRNSHDGDGWTRVQRADTSQEDEDRSLYGFWMRQEDIEFLSIAQVTEPIQELSSVPTAPREVANRFNILSMDSESSDDDDAESNEALSQVALDDWQINGLDAEPLAIVEDSPSVQTFTTMTAEQPPQHENHVSYIEEFFNELDYGSIPAIPQSDRGLDLLLENGNVWEMSSRERVAIGAYWRERARLSKATHQEDQFTHLREKHRKALEAYNEGKEEVRRQLLREIDIVGCTTTGAAKLASLLRGLGPRIMLVEEAGQVLEAHILGSLVPSIEHMILIGDPLQLRPTLNNYSLSVDSKQGSQLYKFDRSLMERLSSSGFPMSQIDVQRRMRPTISTLIRNTLYPNLIDNDLVKQYPDVRGLSKNVFFLDHQHSESGGVDDGGSRYNTYEVEMIRDLVLYLLRQGCYSQDGDIVVLCAYLGQLAKVRDALQDLVAVVIDERDKGELASREEEVTDEVAVAQDIQIEHVKVSKRVRLRTVDNYQGEEAKIVILSLVRNTPPETQRLHDRNRSTIGFLRSENRTNVALSRAKEGLYILGNRSLFASKSRMWESILDELDSVDSVGSGFPIACFRHPESSQYISAPGMLPKVAPDGGCLQPCDARLGCGHSCPYKCHPDDPTHVGVQCMQSCTKLCVRRHPCSKSCSQVCGKCTFKIRDVELPCGHVAPFVFCHQLEALEEVKCAVKVIKALPSCEHHVSVDCSVNPEMARCNSLCGGVMSCCGRTCNSKCIDCQVLNGENTNHARIQRQHHKQHPCERSLYCAHRCGKPCSTRHECTTVCKQECRQQCSHSKCKQFCSTLCSPCQRPCEWICPHYSCPVPCGSVCVRLPCDKRCDSFLECGHRCPSVCGEKCDKQICPQCGPEATKQVVVDLVLYRTLDDIPADASKIEDLIVTLPDCGHVFTVETLDGICNLKDWYLYNEMSDNWTGLRVPDQTLPDAKKPPLCPTCRKAITAARYGRVYKSADLEILEKNVISRMTSDLNSAHQLLQALPIDKIQSAIDSGIRQLTSLNRVVDSAKKLKLYQLDRQTLLAQASPRGKPFPVQSLTPLNSKKPVFGPSDDIIRIWETATHPLVTILSQLGKIADIRSAHVHAWESAFAYVFNQELDCAILNPRKAPRRPDEHAMRMARIKLGQPQPRSDKRFLAEAIWLSVQARFTLASFVQKLLDSMKAATIQDSASEMRVWGTYALFILDSCKDDANISFDIASDCDAHRLMTRSIVYILRASLQHFQLRYDMTKRFGNVPASRDKLLEDVEEGLSAIREKSEETKRRHLAILSHDETWLEENFFSAIVSMTQEWDNLKRAIGLDTFYQPVSTDEKVAIVKAFNFSHAGHWYNCPNGHTYVIDDCGGAMMRSRCPDCGETIGGDSHRADNGNTLAQDFAEIAQQQGAGQSLWHR